MEIPQSKALELIGAQQIEITILRERIGILSQHQCEPCGLEHVVPADDVAPAKPTKKARP